MNRDQIFAAISELSEQRAAFEERLMAMRMSNTPDDVEGRIAAAKDRDATYARHSEILTKIEAYNALLRRNAIAEIEAIEVTP